MVGYTAGSSPPNDQAPERILHDRMRNTIVGMNINKPTHICKPKIGAHIGIQRPHDHELIVHPIIRKSGNERPITAIDLERSRKRIHA